MIGSVISAGCAGVAMPSLAVLAASDAIAAMQAAGAATASGAAPSSAGESAYIPPNASPKKGWAFFVFEVGGHGLTDDFRKMNRQLSLKGTNGDAHIVIRAEGEGGRLVNYAASITDPEHDGRLDQYESGAEAGRYLGCSILDKDAMSSFLIEAAERFPSERICVSFVGHSGQLRQVIPAIHGALERLKEELDKKIDILLFDSCFMAQIEVATEFEDMARYMVASQEGVVRFRSYPVIERMLKETGTSAEALAKKIALENEEFTFSAIDLERISPLNQAIRVLGQTILRIRDDKALGEIRRAARKSTGYYTEGLFAHNHFSSTIDFKGFIAHILQSRYLHKNFSDLIFACDDVLGCFGREGEGVVIAERHARSVDQYVLDITDPRGSHGLSIHQPVTPKPFRNPYTHLPDSHFSRVTNWDRVIEHITSTRTPLYLAYSFLSFASGLFVAGLNNLIQRVMELFER